MKGKIKRLIREASSEGILVRLRDGGAKVFDDVECFGEMFLAQTSLFKGEARDSEVLRAVRNATLKSRREFEDKYGPIEMRARIICPPVDGGWVEEFDLLEDGTVKGTYHEADSEEAARIRQEARQRGPAS